MTERERSIHRHRMGQYFLAVVGTLATLCAIILLALGTTAFVRSSEQIKHNTEFRQNQVRVERLAIVTNAQSELTECRRNNKQDRLLARLLGFSVQNRQRRGDPLDRSERVFLASLLRSLRGVDCHTVPSVALAELRYGPIKTPTQETRSRHEFRIAPNEGGHP